MNRATKIDSGVNATTTSAMRQSMNSMTPSVPKIVSTPVNSWVKPISRPSLNCSTSVVMRLIASPGRWASIYLSGRISSWPNARTRISRTT